MLAFSACLLTLRPRAPPAQHSRSGGPRHQEAWLLPQGSSLRSGKRDSVKGPALSPCPESQRKQVTEAYGEAFAFRREQLRRRFYVLGVKELVLRHRPRPHESTEETAEGSLGCVSKKGTC